MPNERTYPQPDVMGQYRILLFPILMLFCCPAWAQPKLLLLKSDSRYASFEEGELIRFQKKGEQGFRRGYITGIHTNFFRIGEDTTYTYEIAQVDLRGKKTTGFKTAALGNTLVIAGASVFLIDIFNTTVVNDDTYQLDGGTLAVSLALVGSGALLRIFNNNYFKPGRKKKITTIGR